MRKLVFIIVDGLGDSPIELLNQKTPLDYAYTPNISALLSNSAFFYPSVLGKLAPESDLGVLANLGYDPYKFSTGRGWFECLGLGLSPNEGDLSLRVNFGEVTNGKINTVRVNMRPEEIKQLETEINENVKLSVPFLFKAGVSYRGSFDISGETKKLSHFISNNQPGYDVKFYSKRNKIGIASKTSSDRVVRVRALRKGAAYTARLANEFVAKASAIVKKSEVYSKRKLSGLPVPNFVFCRDGAVYDPSLPSLEETYGRKWAAIVGMPLEIGIARSAGMKVLNVEELADAEADLRLKAEVLKSAFKSFDAIYMHIKHTDAVSHLGKYTEKYHIIELIDKILVAEVRNLMDKEAGDTMVLSADHCTSSLLKRHTNDRIPVLLVNKEFGINHKFSEEECRKHAKRNVDKATEIMPFVFGMH
jgi:2,3-bisphosphoglycerate-independent phosphoglycerate mutase